MLSAEGLSYATVRLRYFPCVSILLSVFIINSCICLSVLFHLLSIMPSRSFHIVADFIQIPLKNTFGFVAFINRILIF